MIWFVVAAFAIGFIGALLLMPKPKTEDARPSSLDDVNFPTAGEGAPIALLLGRARLKGPNTLWYGDFSSKAITKKVKTGLFSSKRVTVGYKYYLGLALGLCFGDNVTLRKIWFEKDEVWSGTAGPATTAININKPSLWGGEEKGGGFIGTLRFYGGAFNQTVNSYLAAKVAPDEMPAYIGQSYLVWEKCYIGTQAQLRAPSFEIARYTNGLGLAGGIEVVGDDLNPAELIFQLMTTRWGGLDVDVDELDLDSMRAAAQTLFDEGNGMSLLITSANRGRQAIEEVLRQVDGVMYQDPITGKIMLELIRFDYLIEELPILDESVIVGVRNFSRSLWEDTVNQVRVTFPRRDNKYEKGSAIAQDLANINAQGRLRSTTVSFPGCFEPDLAADLATRELSQMSVPLFKATIEVNRVAGSLRPGDPFIWSWPEYGLVQVVMRVQRFSMGDLLDGRIVIEAIQDQFAVNQTIFAPPEPTRSVALDLDAQPITEAAVIEAPYWVMQNQDYAIVPPSTSQRTFVMAMARQPAENQQGYTATIEQGAESAVAVDHQPFTETATLAVGIGKAGGFSTGLLASIEIENVSDDGDWLEVASAAETAAGANLLLIGSELISYETFTDNLDGTFTLGNVRRALLDTRAQDHMAGAVIYRLSADAISAEEWLASTSLTAKLQSFTASDETIYADADAFPLVPDRRYERPLPPDYLTLAGNRSPGTITSVGPHTVAWRPRSRLTATIQSENASADTEEGGVTYTMRVFYDGVLQAGKTQTGLASPTANLTLDPVNVLVAIEVSAVRDGLESRTAGWLEFTLNAGAAAVPATFSANWMHPSLALTNSGRTITHTSATAEYQNAATRQAKVSGKHYLEATLDNFGSTPSGYNVGVCNYRSPLAQNFMGVGNDAVVYAVNGNIVTNNGTVGSLGAPSAGDIIGIALDADAGTVKFRRNGGAWSSDISIAGGGPFMFCATTNYQNAAVTINSGQTAFAHAIPAGYAAWSDNVSAVARRYSRIHLEARQGGPTAWIGLMEVELRATAGGADVSAGLTATASASIGGNEPDKAIDDNLSTNWTTGNSSLPAWWQADHGVGVDQAVAEFTVVPPNVNQAPVLIKLVQSADGVNFYPVKGVVTPPTWVAAEQRVFTVT